MVKKDKQTPFYIYNVNNKYGCQSRDSKEVGSNSLRSKVIVPKFTQNISVGNQEKNTEFRNKNKI